MAGQTSGRYRQTKLAAAAAVGCRTGQGRQVDVFDELAYRASGLNLLVAAIILWNTRYLQAAFDALRHRGAAVPAELIRHVAPLGWEHIGLTGDYVWAEEAQPTPGLLRPLHDKPSLLAA